MYQIFGACITLPTLHARRVPDRPLWLDAMQKELRNMELHVAEPVLEDTLSTWDALKGFAREVVNLLWVLKKKYVDGKFERCKGRTHMLRRPHAKG